MLYAQWRFRGVDPWVAHNGRHPRQGEPMWPSRLNALLVAFAWEAAEREKDVQDLKEGLMDAFGGGQE